MIDWEGLLKFSLKYSDGTHKSQFKQMKEEDKKFLQQVMQEYCNSDVKRLQEIVKQLSQISFESDQTDKIDILQQMQELLDSLDRGDLLYKINGHVALLRMIFYSKINNNRNLALQLLSSANQNDVIVQNQSINVGALQIMDLIQKQTDMKVKQNMMGTISSIIRGQNLQAKRIFIRIGGLQLLKKLLNQQSNRMNQKIMVLIRDLLYYDDYLHQTYKDLSSFSNTAGLKSQNGTHDLTYDINVQKIKQNQKPQNKKYKGVIAQFLNQNKQIKDKYEIWLKKQQQK